MDTQGAMATPLCVQHIRYPAKETNTKMPKVLVSIEAHVNDVPDHINEIS